MIETIEFHTAAGQLIIDLKPQVDQIVKDSRIQEGVCYVYSPHTTAALMVTSQFEDTREDIITEMDRLIPLRPDFVHQWDPPADAAGHVKTGIFGVSQFFLLAGGELILGHAQGILFYEFDGDRDRQVYVKIIPG